jgi:hypothetical protein
VTLHDDSERPAPNQFPLLLIVFVVLLLIQAALNAQEGTP